MIQIQICITLMKNRLVNWTLIYFVLHVFLFIHKFDFQSYDPSALFDTTELRYPIIMRSREILSFQIRRQETNGRYESSWSAHIVWIIWDTMNFDRQIARSVSRMQFRFFFVFFFRCVLLSNNIFNIHRWFLFHNSKSKSFSTISLEVINCPSVMNIHILCNHDMFLSWLWWNVIVLSCVDRLDSQYV